MPSGQWVSQFGDWDKAQQILKEGMAPVMRAVGKAWRKEAQLLRKEVQKGMQSQAPGGKQFKPLAPTTLAIRRFLGFRGTKALLWHRNLYNAVKVTPDGRAGSSNYQVFVGIHRDARDPFGKSLFMIGMRNEIGGRPIVLKITPRMMRFLGAAFASLRSGVDKPWWLLRKKASKGVIVINTPVRPVFGPIWEAQKDASAKRISDTVESELKGKLSAS
jgi:hypothetical protein